MAYTFSSLSELLYRARRSLVLPTRRSALPEGSARRDDVSNHSHWHAAYRLGPQWHALRQVRAPQGICHGSKPCHRPIIPDPGFLANVDWRSVSCRRTRYWFWGLSRRRYRADYAGVALRQCPREGSRRHQHRQRVTAGGWLRNSRTGDYGVSQLYDPLRTRGSASFAWRRADLAADECAVMRT